MTLRKLKPPSSHVPWRSVIVAVDPGERAGVSIWINGKLLSSCALGLTASFVAELVYHRAEIERLPLVFVIEKHSPYGRKWTTATKEGMGRYVGRWLDAIEALPRRRPTTKVLRVYPQTWRAAIFGTGYKNFSTDDWKRMALARVNCDKCDGCRVTSADEAEAILIGRFACHWGEVGKLAGVK
jgi:hypothetical protein